MASAEILESASPMTAAITVSEFAVPTSVELYNCNRCTPSAREESKTWELESREAMKMLNAVPTSADLYNCNRCTPAARETETWASESQEAIKMLNAVPVSAGIVDCNRCVPSLREKTATWASESQEAMIVPNAGFAVDCTQATAGVAVTISPTIGAQNTLICTQQTTMPSANHIDIVNGAPDIHGSAATATAGLSSGFHIGGSNIPTAALPSACNGLLGVLALVATGFAVVYRRKYQNSVNKSKTE